MQNKDDVSAERDALISNAPFPSDIAYDEKVHLAQSDLRAGGGAKTTPPLSKEQIHRQGYEIKCSKLFPTTNKNYTFI